MTSQERHDRIDDVPRAVADGSGSEAVPAGASVLDSAITTVVEVEHAIRRLTALRTVLLHGAVRLVPLAEEALLRPASSAARSPLTGQERELARRAFVADLAAALQLPESTTSGLVAEAEVLVEDLPRTLAVVADGTMSYRHAQVVVEHTADLDTDARGAVEAAALPFAATSTPTGLARRVRRVREVVHPEPAVVRHRRAAADRKVRIDPAPDGMSWLSAFLPAAQGHAICDRLDHAAQTLAGPDEPRTVDQLRTDAFVALLLDDADGTAARSLAGSGVPGADEADDRPGPDAALASLVRAVVPRVAVTVPALTLLGHDEDAVLEGYGPIDPETARLLAAGAPSLTRILTHPETGAVLSVGRDTYRVPADLRRHLAVRDGTCRFPGCGRPARRCDVDHVTAAADAGATDASNLIHLCRHHHRLKHETSWRVRLDAMTQDAVWRSPSGRVHVVPPAEPGPVWSPPAGRRPLSRKGVRPPPEA